MRTATIRNYTQLCAHAFAAQAIYTSLHNGIVLLDIKTFAIARPRPGAAPPALLYRPVWGSRECV